MKIKNNFFNLVRAICNRISDWDYGLGSIHIFYLTFLLKLKILNKI